MPPDVAPAYDGGVNCLTAVSGEIGGSGFGTLNYIPSGPVVPGGEWAVVSSVDACEAGLM